MKLFQISLTWQMVLATFLGIFFGLFFGESCRVFAPWGSAYIMILKITTVPYLAFAIMQGIGQLQGRQAWQILKKGLFFIALFWAINITMIYLTVFLFPGVQGASLAGYMSSKPASINFAEVLIPENIFYALSNNIVPAIVIFSLLIGISLIHVKETNTFMQLLGVIVSALTKITAWISRITPFGTFLIIANQVGTIEFSTVKQVSTYILLYIFSLGLLIIWVFPRLISMLTNISTGRWLRDLFPILVLGYTTNVVIVCIPFIIELVKREIQRIVPSDDEIQRQIQGIVSVAFNLPLGSLFIVIFIFFLSAFYGMPLNITGQIQLFISAFLTSLGSAGLGGWINSLTFILETLNLPIEAVNIYLTTLPFTSGLQSMISVMEIASLALLITLACNQLLYKPSLYRNNLKNRNFDKEAPQNLDPERATIAERQGASEDRNSEVKPTQSKTDSSSCFGIFRLIRKSAFTAGPILALALVLKSFNPLPRIENTTKSIYDVCINNALTGDQYIAHPTPSPTAPNEDVLDKILRLKTLRVGCNLLSTPFSFCNSYGQIVGFDAAMAQELAADLGCRLELVSLSFNHLAEELGRGDYDIGMSGLSITEERLKEVYFTNPYITSSIIFVTTEELSKKLKEKNAIYKHPEWRIGALKGGTSECRARNWFPNHPLVLFDSYDDYGKNPQSTDLFLWAEGEAISWIIHFPRLAIVYPAPPIGNDSLAYAIKFGSDKFLNYLREWLRLKEINGFKEEQYNLWVLGQTKGIEEEKPRWTILHDVLHWGEGAKPKILSPKAEVK